MQDFALSRRDHEQYYTIDWKYIAQDRQLPTWPETREDMQTRLERALNHILKSYTSSLSMAAGGSGDRDLSLVFVTHASPVNALLEACLQTPTLVPVPNCSISRCRWTPLTITDEELSPSFSSSSSGSGSDEDDMNSLLDHHHHKSALLDAMMQSRSIQTVLGEEGRWLLDYQTYTAHLDREHRR
ncbi:hypothetical protein EDD11_009863 [Mortierella claussenii]|nr:hypothetical protein EDD11_009863 [Mortierella claussenii]